MNFSFRYTKNKAQQKWSGQNLINLTGDAALVIVFFKYLAWSGQGHLCKLIRFGDKQLNN